MFGTMYKEFWKYEQSPLNRLSAIALLIMAPLHLILAKVGVYANQVSFTLLVVAYTLGFVYFIALPVGRHIDFRVARRRKLRTELQETATKLLGEIYNALHLGTVPVTQVKALQSLILRSLDDVVACEQLMKQVRTAAGYGEKPLTIALPRSVSKYDRPRLFTISHPKFKSDFVMKF